MAICWSVDWCFGWSFGLSVIIFLSEASYTQYSYHSSFYIENLHLGLIFLLCQLLNVSAFFGKSNYIYVYAMPGEEDGEGEQVVEQRESETADQDSLKQGGSNPSLRFVVEQELWHEHGSVTSCPFAEFMTD